MHILEKVTVFVTRPRIEGHELLLFQHPSAGIQIPAGTVEPGETPVEAACREAREETGLENLMMVAQLGMEEEELPEDLRVVYLETPVYARPDKGSFNWAHFRRGLTVEVLRQEAGFLQVSYKEGDRFPDPSYLTYEITGWVLEETLASRRRRYFYRMQPVGPSPESWEVAADSQVFKLFWAPIAALPPIVEPQSSWVRYLPRG